MRAPVPLVKKSWRERAIQENKMSDQATVDEIMSTPGGQIRAVGGIAAAVQGRFSEFSKDDLAKIDAGHKKAGGLLSLGVEQGGRDPLTVSREWVEAGHMDQNDPRFKAAFELRLDGANRDAFEKKYTSSETFADVVSGFSQEMRESGQKGALVKMRALGASVERGSASASSLAVKLEKIATEESLPGKMSDAIFTESVRFSEAGYLSNSREKSRAVKIDEDQR